MVETGMPAGDYLRLLEDEAGKLLGENRPTDYPKSVAAAWGISMEHVKRQNPSALELLQRCALFGPEPIPRDVLTRGAQVLESKFGEQLQDPILAGQAMRELDEPNASFGQASCPDDGHARTPTRHLTNSKCASFAEGPLRLVRSVCQKSSNAR